MVLVVDMSVVEYWVVIMILVEYLVGVNGTVFGIYHTLPGDGGGYGVLEILNVVSLISVVVEVAVVLVISILLGIIL